MTDLMTARILHQLGRMQDIANKIVVCELKMMLSPAFRDDEAKLREHILAMLGIQDELNTLLRDIKTHGLTGKSADSVTAMERKVRTEGFKLHLDCLSM